MRKPGFTLLETLIALLIVVVILGAALTANRVIQGDALLAEERTQMGFLVDEALNNVMLLQREQRAAGQPLGAATALNVNPGGSNELIVFSEPTTDYAANYNDPIVLQWCTRTPSTACHAEGTPVQDTSVTTVSDLFNSIGGELVAIRKTPGSGRQIVNMTSKLLTDPGAVVNADDTDWDIYIRTIDVVRLAASQGDLYGQDIGGAGNQGIARDSTYVITVTISKYNSSTVPAMQRSIVLTDNQLSGGGSINTTGTLTGGPPPPTLTLTTGTSTTGTTVTTTGTLEPPTVVTGTTTTTTSTSTTSTTTGPPPPPPSSVILTGGLDEPPGGF